MEWGHELKTLEEIHLSTGIAPPALRSKPTLLASGFPYWEAFWYLSQQRAEGFNGPLPIQASEILAYFLLTEIDTLAHRLTYMRMIAAMDRAFFEHRAAKAST